MIGYGTHWIVHIKGHHEKEARRRDDLILRLIIAVCRRNAFHISADRVVPRDDASKTNAKSSWGPLNVFVIPDGAVGDIKVDLRFIARVGQHTLRVVARRYDVAI